MISQLLTYEPFRLLKEFFFRDLVHDFELLAAHAVNTGI
jgi:hypothetical protein